MLVYLVQTCSDGEHSHRLGGIVTKFVVSNTTLNKREVLNKWMDELTEDENMFQAEVFNLLRSCQQYYCTMDMVVNTWLEEGYEVKEQEDEDKCDEWVSTNKETILNIFEAACIEMIQILDVPQMG